MRYDVAVLVFCAVVAGIFSTRPAGAVKPFFEQFKAVYVKPNAKDRTSLIFNAGVTKKGCGVCHRGQPAKKVFNPYGKQLSQLLNAKRDAGNTVAIREALNRVGKMKFNPDDPKSLTFVQRIKQGKLPAGEIIVKSKDGGASGKSTADASQKSAN